MGVGTGALEGVPCGVEGIEGGRLHGGVTDRGGGIRVDVLLEDGIGLVGVLGGKDAGLTTTLEEVGNGNTDCDEGGNGGTDNGEG